MTRQKFVISLPTISNEVLADSLVHELNNVEITWLDETEAVISTDANNEKIKSVFTKYNIKIQDKTTLIKHSQDYLKDKPKHL